jgi:hypothetical protein
MPDNGGRPFSAASVDRRLPGNDDILRDATIREVSQVVFSASPLKALVGYISQPFNAEGGPPSWGSLKSETVKCIVYYTLYIVKYRPVLSSERASDIKTRNGRTVLKIWS